MEQQPWGLLQRYRGDRRKLLEFLLSSGLITELRTPAGSIDALSDVELDKLSADYVLHCIKYGQCWNSIFCYLFGLGLEETVNST
jgi:hypothetical protein